MIASIPGNDWVLLDLEHGAISDSEMHNMLPALNGSGVTPLVRVPAPENAYIKRALDAGAHGIMFPMIETKVAFGIAFEKIELTEIIAGAS